MRVKKIKSITILKWLPRVLGILLTWLLFALMVEDTRELHMSYTIVSLGGGFVFLVVMISLWKQKKVKDWAWSLIPIAYWFCLILYFSFGGFAYDYNLSFFMLSSGPGLILFLILVISWFRADIGGLLFIALGLLFSILGAGRIPWWIILMLGGLAILVGVLFLIGYFNINSQKN